MKLNKVCVVMNVLAKINKSETSESAEQNIIKSSDATNSRKSKDPRLVSIHYYGYMSSNQIKASMTR